MPRRLALIVATYEYQDSGLNRLTAPAREAEDLATALRDPEVAGFDVTLLVDEPHHRVGEAIGRFYADGRRNDLMVLYFIGLGLTGEDGRLYLAMTDTRRDSLPFTSLAAEQIQYAVDGSSSVQKVLILDSAYGNAHARRRFVKAGGEAHAIEPFKGRGCTVLTASDTIQYSFVDDKPRGDAVRSGFTGHVLAGLRDGSADLDGDGEITVDELYAYVHDRIGADKPRYRPKRQSNVAGRTVIARNVKWRPAKPADVTEVAVPVVEPVPRRRRPALVWSAVLGVVLLTVAATLFFTTRDNGTDPALLGEPMTTEKEVRSLAVTRLDGKDVLVSGGSGVVLQLWDLATHQHIEPPIVIGNRDTDVNELTSATVPTELDGRPVIVTLGSKPGASSFSRWVRVWDVAGRRMLGQPIEPAKTVYSVAVGQVDGRTVIVTGGIDGTVLVWDLATHEQIGESFKAHADAVRSMTFGTLDGKPVIVTGGAKADPTVRLWDLTARQAIGQALSAHTDDVVSVALGEAGGKPVVVSSSADFSVRVWDVNSFTAIAPPLLGHTDQILSVAMGRLDSRPVVVAAGRDNLVRVWDLVTHKSVGRPLGGHTEPIFALLVTQVNGKAIVFTGSDDNSIRAWDLAKVR
nr:hypothetical protein [Kibdelosporangium sp. MJ126-NF4]CEL12943.1 Probable serine/threonine-protein kinase pkwA [Kibdelosporangium sp. MJ126-NF4]CTQ98628.1 Probable serine/threonine-protein kinase pkwA (EC 2.7.11.1) [Kibdelosporangium sp. MJ126-NF4]